MFIDIITNIETDKHRVIRSEDIRTITYSGRTIFIHYLTQNGGMRKNHNITYPTVEIAKEQYSNIIAQLRG